MVCYVGDSVSLRRVPIDRVGEIRAGTEALGIDPGPLGGVAGDRINVDIGDELRTSLREALQQSDTEASDAVRVRYVTQHDDRVRPEHAALHGTEWNIDDPMRPVPPLGHGCRCYEELVVTTKAAAKRTGLPMAEKKPPKPGKEALTQFPKGSTSTTTGEEVTAQETFGPTVGKLIESGDITPDQALDQDGNPIQATVLKEAAKAGAVAKTGAASVAAVRLVQMRFLRLQGMGITAGQVRSIVAAARKRMVAKSLTAKEALREVLTELRPGFVTTPARVKRAAREILAAHGGVL